MDIDNSEHIDADEQILDLSLNQIDKDSALFSLFNQCQPHHHQPIIDQNISKDRFLPHQLNIDPTLIERGYWSQCNDNPKKQYFRKHKHIINKKQKRRTKHRTRMYIEMLENRVTELQSEIQKLKKLNKINKEYIHRLSQSEHLINGFFVGRQQLYEKLDDYVNFAQEANQEKEEKVFQTIQSLRLRQGVFGKDRLKAVNYYFKEMTEMLLPQIQKYIAKTAIEQTDFFDIDYLKDGEHRIETEGWRRKMLEKIDIGSQAISTRAYFNHKRSQILAQIKTFDQILQQFYQLKCSLSKQARKMQQLFDDAHAHLSLPQIIQVLSYIDHYRFEKGVRLQQILPTVYENIKGQNLVYNSTNRLFQRRVSSGKNNQQMNN